MGNSALIGYTGFVGAALIRNRRFDGLFNSKNLRQIEGEAFEEVICSAAPAVMWAANQDPARDLANLESIVASLRKVKIGRIILISSIAVFDDASAGYDETNSRYQVINAYGRNRRLLEEACVTEFAQVHIVRLPALFGHGLKKNFLFDLINPIPSFVRPLAFDAARKKFTDNETRMLQRHYSFDTGLRMWKLDRQGLNASTDRLALVAAFERAGLEARQFTNSGSRFQFYNIDRLARDIETVVSARLSVVNFCSPPIQAAALSLALTSREFHNPEPPLVCENVHSIHAASFGAVGNYLFDGNSVLNDLRSFYQAEVNA